MRACSWTNTPHSLRKFTKIFRKLPRIYSVTEPTLPKKGQDNIYSHKKACLPPKSSVLTACPTRMKAVNDVAPFDYTPFMPGIFFFFQTSKTNEYINTSCGGIIQVLNKGEMMEQLISTFFLGALLELLNP